MAWQKPLGAPRRSQCGLENGAGRQAGCLAHCWGSLLDGGLVGDGRGGQVRWSLGATSLHTSQRGWVGFRALPDALCLPPQCNGSECTYQTFTSAVQAVSEWYVLQSTSILSQLPESERVAMGYQAEEMILACLYGAEPCNPR